MKLVSDSLRDLLVRVLQQLDLAEHRPLEANSGLFSAPTPPGYASQKGVYRLFSRLPARIDGEPAGLAIARRFQPDGLGLALRIACHRATLGEAIESYFDFQHLVHPPFTHLERDLEEGRAAVVVEPQDFRLAAATREVRTVFQSALALRCYRVLVGDDSVEPVAVEFMEVTPGFQPAYEEHFGAPVSVNPDRGRLILREQLLDRPIVAADARAYPYLKELGEIRSRELTDYANRESQLIEKVRTFIVHVLGVETPTQQQAARHLGMSRRTMQRRLDDEGG